MHFCWNNKIYQSVKRKNSLICSVKVIGALFSRVQNISFWDQQNVKEICAIAHQSTMNALVLLLRAVNNTWRGRSCFPAQGLTTVSKSANSHEMKRLPYVCMRPIQELIQFSPSYTHQIWWRCPRKQSSLATFGSSSSVISRMDKFPVSLWKEKSCQPIFINQH